MATDDTEFERPAMVRQMTSVLAEGSRPHAGHLAAFGSVGGPGHGR